MIRAVLSALGLAPAHAEPCDCPKKKRRRRDPRAVKLDQLARQLDQLEEAIAERKREAGATEMVALMVEGAAEKVAGAGLSNVAQSLGVVQSLIGQVTAFDAQRISWLEAERDALAAQIDGDDDKPSAAEKAARYLACHGVETWGQFWALVNASVDLRKPQDRHLFKRVGETLRGWALLHPEAYDHARSFVSLEGAQGYEAAAKCMEHVKGFLERSGLECSPGYFQILGRVPQAALEPFRAIVLELVSQGLITRATEGDLFFEVPDAAEAIDLADLLDDKGEIREKYTAKAEADAAAKAQAAAEALEREASGGSPQALRALAGGARLIA